MEKYELVKDIGSGNFGVARLMRNKATKELVVMKYIERGLEIDENIAREIINHRSLRHLNIIRFKELVLTPTHLAIVMEYAAGGELFERICNAGRFSEDEARYFFQQLISGVNYCHSMVKRIRREYVENSSGTGQELWQLLFSLPRIFTVMSTTVKALLLNWFLYWGRDSDEACGRWLRCVSFGLFGTKGNVGILRA